MLLYNNFSLDCMNDQDPYIIFLEAMQDVPGVRGY